MRKLLSIIFFVLFCCYAMAYDFSAVCSTGQTLYYNITSNEEPYTVEVTSENTSNPYYTTFPTGNLEIPESVEYNSVTYSVTSIGNSAFENCSGLTGVTIPNSITSIGDLAFSNCGLTSITIPNSVLTIGILAFRYGIYTSVTIGKSVVSIGNQAFWDSGNLTTVNFNAENCTTMGSSDGPVFYSCASLATLNIGENVKSIPDYAFYGCTGLTAITIPDSVTNIGNNAFYGCSGLTTVNFNAKNCTTMGSSSYPVFYNCSLLTTINIGENVKSIPENAFYNCSGIAEITIPDSVTSIGVRAFGGCTGLSEITIPDSVVSIGERAFYGCTGLTTVNFNAKNCTTMGSSNSPVFFNCTLLSTLNFGENVKLIPDYAFYGCSGLTAITIPDSVTNIGNNAFYGCSGLTEITIPDSVTSIGDRAFYGCSGLTTVNFNAQNCTTMGGTNPVFEDCTLLATLNIGENVKSISENAFYGCTGLSEITIPDSITSIGERAFYGCTGLTTVNFNAKNCTTMGSSSNPVFYNCTSFSTLNIGENVENIPGYAFRGCSGLETITIGNSLESIGDYAFDNCSSLTAVYISDISQWCAISFAGLSTNANPLGLAHNLYIDNELVTDLVLPNTITEIKSYAFKDATCLTSVTIPSSVTSIGSQAFYGCSNLTAVNFNAENCTTMGTLSGPVFFNNTSITTLNIGESVKSIPDYAFSDCSGLTEITIPDSVTSIGDRAFSGCSGLTTVNFNAKNCTSTSSGIWYQCSALATLNIGENVKSIPENAFYGCTGLSEITIPDSVVSIGDRAFYGCSGLTTVNFNAQNCTTMGGTNPVFEDCTSFSTLNIGDNVVGIPENAFHNCSNLTSAAIGNSVTNIGSYAFFGCSGLTRLIVPDMVTSIGSQAFYNCSGLDSITIGSSVENIGDYAFHYADNITEINALATTPPVLGTQVFTSTTAKLEVPCSSSAAYGSASGWSDFDNLQERFGYTLNVSTENDQQGTASITQQPSCSDNSGVITATPATGYRFLQWSDGNTENPRTVIVTSDITYSAGFKAAYIITASAGEGGTISPNGDVTVDEGESQTFTIEAEECYSLASVLVDDVDVTDAVVAADGVYTFENVTAGHTIAATFEQITYTITSTAGENGTITPYGAITVNCGDNQAFTIIPAENYRIVWVRVDDIDVTSDLVDGEYTFENVTADHTIAATFELITYTIVATAGNGGTITPDGDVAVEAGSSMAFAIVPNEAYRIATVIVDGENNVTAELVENVYTFENVTADHTIEATFEEIPTQTFTITVQSNNDAYGMVSEGGTFEEGAVFEIAAMPNDGYRFVQWDDGNMDNPRTIIVTSDSTFVANFIQIDIDGGIERRNVLVELFAYKSCGYSPYAAAALDNMEAADSLNIIVIDHHVSDTYGYTESMNRFYYWAEKDDILGQSYGFDGTPSVVFDGYLGISGTNTNVDEMQETYIGYYNNVKEINSIYSLAAEFEQTEFNGRTFSLIVTAEKHSEYFGDDQIVVMAALAEDIDYDWSVAGKINNLVRVLYPDANGTEATFDGNNRFSTSFSITISEEYDISKCKVVVWVENHTQGRVMQSKRFNVMDFYNLQAQQYTITVLSNNDVYGTVSGGGTYDEGSEITLIAMPNQGYLFDSWEDDNAENPRTITVTSDSTFVADFVKCEITQTIDTTVNNFVTVGNHTFYSTGNYSFAALHETDCDTIFDINLTVLAEPELFDIEPNPAKSIVNIHSDSFISHVEFYSPTGQLVMRKEVNGNEAELDVERLMNGVYIVRIYGEESSLPSVYRIVKE